MAGCEGVKHFQKIAEGLPVMEVMAQLYEHPELWSENQERTQDPASPHYGVDDIWARFRAREELTSPERFNEPHFASFYPAWHTLTSLHPIVYGLMSRMKATYLGGILITRIKPGGNVKPHHDRGGWHAENLNCKVYVALQSNAKCVNTCEDEQITMKTGEVFSFDNLKVHSVENNGTEDRVTCIVCMKVEV